MNSSQRKHRVGRVGTEKETRKILHLEHNIDVGPLMKKTVAECERTEYTLSHDKPDQIRSLRKEVYY